MRILFITWTRIGDAVLSTGILDHLLRTHDGARVTVACGPLPAPLFDDVPGVERVIRLAKRPWNGHWLDLWRACAGTRWDLIVDLRSSAVTWLLRARRRIVNNSHGVGEHKVAHLGRLLGVDPPPAPRLWLSDAARRRAAALLPPGPVLALGPTASWRGKEWPAERFAELAGGLTGPGGILPGAAVAVFAAPSERNAVEPLLGMLPADRAVDVAGTADLMTAAACLERCALFVGNDSGPMHLAAAAGVPTLGLFGPTPESTYRPWGPHCRTVRGAALADLPARADFERSDRRTLMEELSVEAVAAAADRLWADCLRDGYATRRR